MGKHREDVSDVWIAMPSTYSYTAPQIVLIRTVWWLQVCNCTPLCWQYYWNLCTHVVMVDHVFHSRGKDVPKHWASFEIKHQTCPPVKSIIENITSFFRSVWGDYLFSSMTDTVTSFPTRSISNQIWRNTSKNEIKMKKNLGSPGRCLDAFHLFIVFCCILESRQKGNEGRIFWRTNVCISAWSGCRENSSLLYSEWLICLGQDRTVRCKKEMFVT